MSEILGYDVDGKPLRAGDRVVYVGDINNVPPHLRELVTNNTFIVDGPPEDWAAAFGSGTKVRLKGHRQLHGTCHDLRKIDPKSDHQPADQEFTEWLRGVGQGVPA